MKFQEFLDEGLSTSHGKVEMAIRELGLKYTIEDTDKAKIFHIGDFTLTSSNSGEIKLNKKGIRGPLAIFNEYNFNKIRSRVAEMLKTHIVDSKETEAA